MKERKRPITDIGDQPALVASGRRPPDRRQISARWLTGTFLTGLTSCTLMGVALFAALDGHEMLVTPPQLFTADASGAGHNGKDGDGRSDRLAYTLPRQSFDARRVVELSTVQRVGEKEIYRTQPFEMVRMSLAEDHSDIRNYPKFNALTLFADAPALTPSENSAQIFGGKIESEMTVATSDFPSSSIGLDHDDAMSDNDAEEQTRLDGLALNGGGVQVAALHYIDPLQFGAFSQSFNAPQTPDVRIVQENVSVAVRMNGEESKKGYAEDVIPFPKDQKIIDALTNANYEGADATEVANTLTRLMGSSVLPAGSVLRIGVETGPDQDKLIRASIYRGTIHRYTVSLDDKGEYVQSHEPEMTPVLKTAFEGGVPTLQTASSGMSTLYDAVYEAVLSYDLSDAMARQIIRTLANDYDMQGRIGMSDNIQIFYPLPEDDKKTQNLEIRYISASVGDMTRRYYRFQSADGTVDYYNEQGRSSKQFLLRKPVPNGVFRSPFGSRRHPILGYVRMHSGVDWAAPRGTPIIAASDGLIIKAGWDRSYGNRTEIRHANGYVTSYSHQNAFAAGIHVGTRVKQGQIIGYVGSTGLSTGPHCHYEVEVNGTKVDPMRIRLPDSKALKGKELEVFMRDRDRIDALIDSQNETKVAQATP